MLPQKIIQNQPTSNMWAWGLGTSGQLGDGTLTNRSSPVQVGVTRDWAAVEAGLNFHVALKDDGTLWSWGSQVTSYGSLGLNALNSRFVPEQIGTLTNWVSIGAGLGNGSAINSSGELFTWGTNNYGGVGDNTRGSANTRSSPVQIGTLTNWAQVTWIHGANPGGGIAIKTDGTLWVWGRNNGGLGDNSAVIRSSPVQIGTFTNWATVAGGASHVMVTKTDGTLWAWGMGTSGQLGDNTATTRSSPVQVGTLTDWLKVAAGSSHSLAIKIDGTLWSWGLNTEGRLGDDSVVTRSSPVQVGTLTNWDKIAGSAGTTLATKTDGTLWAWGLATTGQLGDNTATSKSSPVQIGTLTNWNSVAANGSHTVALKSN